MLKLKLQYFGHVIWRLIHWRRPWCWERLKAGHEGDDRGWDGWMASLTDGHEFEQMPGVVDGQGSLACCSTWGCKESDTTERLNWTKVWKTDGYVEKTIFISTVKDTGIHLFAWDMQSPHAPPAQTLTCGPQIWDTGNQVLFLLHIYSVNSTWN